MRFSAMQSHLKITFDQVRSNFAITIFPGKGEARQSKARWKRKVKVEEEGMEWIGVERRGDDIVIHYFWFQF